MAAATTLLDHLNDGHPSGTETLERQETLERLAGDSDSHDCVPGIVDVGWAHEALTALTGMLAAQPEPKDSRPTVIFPRYHQWGAVRGCVASGRVHGRARRYRIKHSAGSAPAVPPKSEHYSIELREALIKVGLRVTITTLYKSYNADAQTS